MSNVRDLGSPEPFKHFAMEYFERGWHPIPLPPGKKSPPPFGCTGKYDAPDEDTIKRWIQECPEHSNIGLRVPDGLIGIDVDQYKGKRGGKTLGELVSRLGALPPTWVLTARADGISGIRFFRAPMGRAWPGELGPDVQTVHYRHRYAVAYPSIHPDIRKMYRWYPPGAPLKGEEWAASEIPDINGLKGRS